MARQHHTEDPRLLNQHGAEAWTYLDEPCSAACFWVTVQAVQPPSAAQ